MADEQPVEQNEKVTETPEGTPPLKSEETIELEAQKARLEEEIVGLEGTRKSVLEQVEQARELRRNQKENEDSPPPIDTESLKQEIEQSIMAKVSLQQSKLLEEQAKLQKELIASKKANIESINARMASVSSSSKTTSPDSIIESEVELSNDEKAIASEVGLKNPRYLKDVDVRGL